MDNPGLSLFQDGLISINNEQQNQEEVEDLEEQKRRQEELQNLLTNALDDFKYDDSTINSSSNVSIVSDKNYKDVPFDDQLKVLYEVRVREISNLKQEFDNYKIEKDKEINSLKQNLLLFEAEVGHLKVSLRNADSLIEEKISLIRGLEKTVFEKDEILDKLRKENEQNQFEICAYKSTINELQLKLDNNNPFSLSAKRFQSEELQKAHQEQIEKLESLLEGHVKKIESLEQEKHQLKEDLGKIYSSRQQIESENDHAVTYFSLNLKNAQQQCHDLLDAVEALTRENEHIRERLKAAEDKSPIKVTNLQNQLIDYESLSQHLEKLNRLLLDKDNELSALKTKLRFYERDMRELLEYRDMKSNIINFDFNACGDMLHVQQILIIQNEYKNLQKLVREKDDHIASLELMNQELQEKIEETLKQTRDEIQNISDKYSLPQLEIMNADLNKAQETIKELEIKLENAENKEKKLLDLNRNLDEMYKFSKSQLESVQTQLLSSQKNYECDKQNLEVSVRNLQDDLKNAENEVSRLQKVLTEFKHVEAELREQNTELQSELSKIKTCSNEAESNLKTSNSEQCENDALKTEYKQLKKQFHETLSELEQLKCLKQNDNDFQECAVNEAAIKISNLEDAMVEIIHAKTIVEREKSDLELKLKECEEKLQTSEKEIDQLRTSLLISDKKHEEFDAIKQSCEQSDIKIKRMEEQKRSLQKEILHRNNIIQTCEEEKLGLQAALQDFKGRLVGSKQETDSLQKEIMKCHNEFNDNKTDRATNTSTGELNNKDFIENEVLYSENFKKCLQSELLKYELQMREHLQDDYINKLQKVEEKYKKTFSDNNKKHKAEIDELKKKENNFRLQFGQMLSECAEKISEMEARNHELKDHLSTSEQELSEYKLSANQQVDELIKLLQKVRFDAENTIASWKSWSKSLLAGCMDVEKVSQKSREKVLYTIKAGNAKMTAVEKEFDERIRRLKDQH